jgi:hypoxanthine phosphoribosyltransferase
METGFRNYRGERPPLFNHPVELEFAKILDAYGLAWLYEPHTFPLRAQRPDGEVVDVGPRDLVDGQRLPPDWRLVEAFSPDFYLPAQDLYLETTVMRQSLVTKKNQKARLTRERYGVRVKILYRRDFERLAKRFGFELPPPGQTLPPPHPTDSGLGL